MTTRRSFLKGIIGAASTFIVPELILPERRFWALDRTMLGTNAEPPFAYQYEVGYRRPVMQAGQTYRVKLDGLEEYPAWKPGHASIITWELSHVDETLPEWTAFFTPEHRYSTLAVPDWAKR